jgi:hypothetical protein
MWGHEHTILPPIGHITRGSRYCLEKKENPNTYLFTAYEKVWGAEKAVLRGKFPVRNIY